MSPIRPRHARDATAYVQTAHDATALKQSNPVLVDRPSDDGAAPPIEGDEPKPPASKAVRNRYLLFISEYVKDPGNAYRAYMRVYKEASPTCARTASARLLAEPWVAAQIDARMRKILAASDITTQEIVTGVKRIAYFDVRRLYKRDRESGAYRMREPWELDDATAMAIDSLKIKPGMFGETIEYKSAGKMPAYEMLARYKGMLKEPEHPPIVANIQINFGG